VERARAPGPDDRGPLPGVGGGDHLRVRGPAGRLRGDAPDHSTGLRRTRVRPAAPRWARHRGPARLDGPRRHSRGGNGGRLPLARRARASRDARGLRVRRRRTPAGARARLRTRHHACRRGACRRAGAVRAPAQRVRPQRCRARALRGPRLRHRRDTDAQGSDRSSRQPL
ncbi:MAG: hypothetical protein AVDCRST_MAG72-2432, partial [uncultured Nocardioidaceae bacterium]